MFNILHSFFTGSTPKQVQNRYEGPVVTGGISKQDVMSLYLRRHEFFFCVDALPGLSATPGNFYS